MTRLLMESRVKRKLWRVGEEELKYIEEALNGGLSGAMNARFEDTFARKFEVRFALGVNSGTSALHCALFAAGVGPGDEVIVPALTFAAPALAAVHAGAIPIYADIDPETFTISPKAIKGKITKKTKAIVAVALYGLPSDLDPIMELARTHNLMVIEDNAQCYLGTYKRRLAGTIGHIAIYSLERSKHMTTGNGGVIVTNDETLAERARKFSILGYTSVHARQASYKASKDVIQRPDFMRHEFLGYNYRLPEICAAMALAQLEKLDDFVARRRRIAEIYGEAVRGCNWLVPQRIPEGYVSSCWTYAMKLKGELPGVSWTDFRKTFLAEGGDRYYAAWAVNYFEPALRRLKLGDRTIEHKEGFCPIAEDVQKRIIQLKTNYEGLTEAEEQAAALARTIRTLN